MALGVCVHALLYRYAVHSAPLYGLKNLPQLAYLVNAFLQGQPYPLKETSASLLI